jgi:hypothetical protein
VRGVAGRSCPIRAVLDRVVVTSTGVVVSCWQVGDTNTIKYLPAEITTAEMAGLTALLKQSRVQIGCCS